ncbi:MAG: DegV family EDD domain-containing protein [Lachnospiraceae bacterium]|nr:DegV family EDD domain-containing protein [Lachnospiraceae bacterium]
MKITRIKDFIMDHNREVQDRLFVLTMSIGITALTLIMIIGMFLGESITDILAMAIGLLISIVLAVISIKTGKIQVGATIVALMIVFLLLPVTFLTSGAVNGGTPMWFIFCALFIGLILKGKNRLVCLFCEMVSAAVCYYVAYYHPEFVTEHSRKLAFLDSFSALILVSILVSSLAGFEIVIYRRESERAKLQKKEIDDLSQAQNQFFSSMSHEIRTPINTIIGLNEMILREDISEEVAEDARSIQSASKLLLHLINDILDMSKAEAGKMDVNYLAYNTGDMLSEIVDMLWLRAREKGLTFHVEVDPALPVSLIGDEIKIKEVLINLLTNAVKYTKQGDVTLSIQSEKISDTRVKVIYSVIDTGVGIKKENLPYIFSAFKRVDEENNRYIEGTGLGLSISQKYVQMMGGQLRVNSIYRQGSTFIMELEQEINSEELIGKVDVEARHAMNRQRHYKQSFEAPRAHILVVDDSKANLMVTEKLLRDTKVQLDTVSSGEEALKKTLDTEYDLILMDHLMPEMDGIETLRRIRKQMGGRCKESKVVALTANAGAESRELYKKEGFDGYLEKPVTGQELEAEIIHQLPREKITKIENSSGMEQPLLETDHRRKKSAILITTDSVCDLPRELVSENDLDILPYHVQTDRGIFLDEIETDSRGLILHIRESYENVKSESPSVEEYEAFFSRVLTRTNHIVHIAMASKVSNGYDNALEAAKSFGNVDVIDSGHLSSGMGLIVLAACRMAAKNMNASDLVDEIRRLSAKVHTSFIVDDTNYLARAGRISAKVATLANTFLLRPVLVLNKSKMSVGKVLFGAREKSWRRYIASSLESWGSIDKRRVFVTYVALSKEDQDFIREEILKRVGFEEVIFQKASPAISINCGPQTFGVLYMEK